jgi:conjugation system TraG family ATPase
MLKPTCSNQFPDNRRYGTRLYPLKVLALGRCRYHHFRKHLDIRPCFNTYYEYLTTFFFPNIQHDPNFDPKLFNQASFLKVLSDFATGGKYDYLLYSETNIDLLNKRFVVFELDNIKDHPIIFPVVTIIIMETFINKMRRLQGIRKMILIEEAWKAIAKAKMADYIKYLFKTVRKHFGEAVIVTQEVDDIIGSDIVKDTIINNSDCKILLDQSKYMNRFTEIQRLLGLTDKQTAQILSLNKNNHPNLTYKEVFIGLGDRSAVYATEVSKQEYWAYTTKQQEKKIVVDKANEVGSITSTIRELTNQ